MAWWIWLVCAVALYLVLCLFPWLAQSIIHAALRRRGPFVTLVLPRIESLVDAERRHSAFWPEEPRPSRYEEIDREALHRLEQLRGALAQINEEADRVAAYVPENPSLGRVLMLGAWQPLLAAHRALADRRHLDAHLAGAEALASALEQQESQAAAVPDRLQADLGSAQAEIRRLYAQWEAEVQSGTRDIQALGDGLALVDNAISGITETVRSAGADDQLGSVIKAEQQLAMASETILRAESELEAVRSTRLQAQQAVGLVQETQGQVSARWAELTKRGARDTAVAARVEELAQMNSALDATLSQATPAAWAQAVQYAAQAQAAGTSITGELQALEDVMTRSAAAVSGSGEALEDAEAALKETQALLPGLVLDSSTRAVTEGRDMWFQSQQQLGMGTWHGYQTALTLAEQVRTMAAGTMAALSEAQEAYRSLCARRDQASDTARQGLRERALALVEEWSQYGRHWHPLRQEALATAVAALDRADEAWSALPEVFRTGGPVGQSQLAAIADAMSPLTEAYEKAFAGITSASADLDRIVSLRAQLEAGLSTLTSDLVPDLASKRDTMLPELADRYDTWLAGLEQQKVVLADPGQVDYERTVGQWLPEVQAEGESIRTAYAGDVAHYGKQLEDVRRRLERSWQRLARLNPQQKPLPQEDIEKLTADYQEWAAAAEAEADNPAALATLVTHQAGDLERRIELARRQISDGRQSLQSLARQFDQLAQSLNKTRSSLRVLKQDSQWQRIDWVLGSGEEPWERALAAQSSSREAEALELAINEMRRAVTTGQEALQIYAGTEQQLRSALERLSREYRAVMTGLDRAQRRANQLRQQGPSDELDALDEQMSSATSLVSMAQNASNFEDALRHLTGAQQALAD